ncbi:hypothetical protein [Streptomyces sp. t39]|uniref:hypothetical protein n=1 Tax=Streptomyces sp. t39 TaxID=1828156 RepID=UPI0011CE6D04|nr:hypothetical protein [Streptomyces sp. t39]TXS55056.1 hypothetical protein EAO77_01695 [Streptomyces sp. t39]
MSTAPATAPLLNSQILGRAHYAARALLDRELARSGHSFLHSIVLGALAAEGGEAGRDTVTEYTVRTVKVPPADARRALTELVDGGYVRALGEDSGPVGLTREGEALRSRLAAFSAEAAPQVYGDIPAEDLAVAGRVLLQVMERAEALYARTADRY